MSIVTAASTSAPASIDPAAAARYLRDQRARRAELLYDSLDDAGLPADERFRTTFRSSIEWGTRIAQRNSQVGFTPPRGARVPTWPWAAGPDE